jgi:hypothetical protein
LRLLCLKDHISLHYGCVPFSLKEYLCRHMILGTSDKKSTYNSLVVIVLPFLLPKNTITTFDDPQEIILRCMIDSKTDVVLPLIPHTKLANAP